MLSDALIGLVRTAVPALAGSCIAWFITAGLALEFEADPELSVGLVMLCTMIYYAVFTMLERRVSPWIGWLLGFPRAPAYGYDDGE